MGKLATLTTFIKVLNQINKYNKATKKQVMKCRAEGDLEGEREIIRENTGIYISNIANICHVDVDVEGAENIPENGPVVIFANHQGYADVLGLYLAIRKFQFGFVGKQEFKKIKAMDVAFNLTRSVFLHRGDARAALETIKTTTELLNDGFSLCVFPEGTRSRGPVPGEFKDGAFKFAQKAKVPVLPVTINDSYKMFEVDDSFHPCTVKVKIHPVVHIEDMSRGEQKEAWGDIVNTITSSIRES